MVHARSEHESEFFGSPAITGFMNGGVTRLKMGGDRHCHRSVPRRGRWDYPRARARLSCRLHLFSLVTCRAHWTPELGSETRAKKTPCTPIGVQGLDLRAIGTAGFEPATP